MTARRRSQPERAATTRAALLDAGRALFTEYGAAHVSTEQIVAAAGVTRGALYHHFRDRDDLFRAVFEQLEAGLAEELGPVLDGSEPANALAAFLDVCERPEVRRIALTDAPAVLGWQQWREIEMRHGLGMIVTRMEALAEAGAPLAAPPAVLAPMLFSATLEGALLIAAADDPRRVRAEVEHTLGVLLAASLSGG